MQAHVGNSAGTRPRIMWRSEAGRRDGITVPVADAA